MCHVSLLTVFLQRGMLKGSKFLIYFCLHSNLKHKPYVVYNFNPLGVSAFWFIPISYIQICSETSLHGGLLRRCAEKLMDIKVTHQKLSKVTKN